MGCRMRLPLSIMMRFMPKMTYDLIRKKMSASVPFAKHVGVVIDSLEPGRAVVSLPLRAEGLNHIGSQHAGALFTLGETASGAAMAGTFAEVIQNVRPVAAKASITYLAMARGPVKAVATTQGSPTELLETLRRDGKVRFPIEVALTAADGRKVAEMTVEWHVSKK